MSATGMLALMPVTRIDPPRPEQTPRADRPGRSRDHYRRPVPVSIASSSGGFGHAIIGHRFGGPIGVTSVAKARIMRSSGKARATGAACLAGGSGLAAAAVLLLGAGQAAATTSTTAAPHTTQTTAVANDPSSGSTGNSGPT